MVRVRARFVRYSEDHSKCLFTELRSGHHEIDVFARTCIRLEEGRTNVSVSLPSSVDVPLRGDYEVEAVNLVLLNRDGCVAVNGSESPRCKLTITDLTSRLTLLPGDLICTFSVRDIELAPYDTDDNLEEDSDEAEEIEELDRVRLLGDRRSSDESGGEEGEEASRESWRGRRRGSGREE